MEGRKNSKETLLTLSLAFLVLFVIRRQDWMLYTAMGISLTGILWPWMSRMIHIAWFWLTDKVGFVVSRVILTVVFVVLVIPFGLLSRLFRKDLLFMKDRTDSTFIKREHTCQPGDFENLW